VYKDVKVCIHDTITRKEVFDIRKNVLDSYIEVQKLADIKYNHHYNELI
jgi:hypothetical protein